MERSRIAWAVLIAGAILAALLVRIPRFDDSCLWFDEVFSVQAASKPWAEILSFVALDLIHPPLFYLLLKIWISIGGESVAWLRLLPTLLFVVSIIPFVLLLRELKQDFRATSSGLIYLIVSGSILKYSLEVRMYGLMFCLSLFGLWIFVRYLNRGAGIWLVLVVNLLLVYTHYFGWFVIASQLLVAALFYRHRVKSLLAVSGACAVGFAPWLYAVVISVGLGSGLEQNIGWMARPGIRELVTFALNLIEPFYYQTGSSQPVARLFVSIPVILLLGTIAFSAAKKIDTSDREEMAVMAVFVLVPAVTAFILSWVFPYSIWGTRHLVIVFAPFFVVAAILTAGLLRLESTCKRGIVAMLGLVFAGAGIADSMREQPRFAWCEMERLFENGSPGETGPIYAVEDLMAYHLWFIQRQSGQPAEVIRLEGVDGIAEDRAYFLPRGFEEVRRENVTDVKAARIGVLHRGRQLSENEPPIRNLRQLGYTVVDKRILDADGDQVGLFTLEKQTRP